MIIVNLLYGANRNRSLPKALCALACIAALRLVPAPYAAAEQTATEVAPSASKSKITMLHTVPLPAEIPPVGSLMRIRVSLTNTIDIESKVRLVGSKDGRFIDIAFPRGTLNASDLPSFAVDIPSPIAAMSYQFIVHQDDGTLSTSPKFVLRRGCIQNFKVEVPDEGASASFKRDMASLIAKANQLDRDNKSLDASLKLLEEMQNSLAR